MSDYHPVTPSFPINSATISNSAIPISNAVGVRPTRALRKGRKKLRIKLLEEHPYCSRCNCHVDYGRSCINVYYVRGNFRRVLVCLECNKDLSHELNKTYNGAKGSRRVGSFKKARGKRRTLLEVKPLCHYCEVELGLEDSTLDHVVPRSNGGLNKEENIVLACIPCNSNKGSSTENEFRASKFFKERKENVQASNRNKKASA